MTADMDIEYLHAVLSPAGLASLFPNAFYDTEGELLRELAGGDDDVNPDDDGYYHLTGYTLSDDFSFGFARWFYAAIVPAFEPGVRILDHGDGEVLYVVVDGKVVAHSPLIVYPTFETFGDIIEKVQAASS